MIADSRKMDKRLGVIAIREDATKDEHRKQQIEALTKAYNKACDSLNVYGVSHYEGIVSKFYRVDSKTIKAIPRQHYEHAMKPKQF
jgi:NitT/TauT family transport system substrate-binding protein